MDRGRGQGTRIMSLGRTDFLNCKGASEGGVFLNEKELEVVSFKKKGK